jgi:hypothetical protein
LRPVLAVSLAVVGLALAPACGGAAPSDLLTSPEMTGDQGGSDAESSGDATMTSPETSSPEPEGGESDDAPVGPVEAAAMDAMAVEAATEAGPSTGLQCSNGTTTLYCPAGDFCCLSGGLVSTASCDASGTACLGGSELHCASAADCTGNQVCCAQEQLGFTATYTATCAGSCSGTTKTQLCKPGSGNGVCPMGETCGASTTLPGYSQCH